MFFETKNEAVKEEFYPEKRDRPVYLVSVWRIGYESSGFGLNEKEIGRGRRLAYFPEQGPSVYTNLSEAYNFLEQQSKACAVNEGFSTISFDLPSYSSISKYINKSLKGSDDRVGVWEMEVEYTKDKDLLLGKNNINELDEGVKFRIVVRKQYPILYSGTAASHRIARVRRGHPIFLLSLWRQSYETFWDKYSNKRFFRKAECIEYQPVIATSLKAIYEHTEYLSKECKVLNGKSTITFDLPSYASLSRQMKARGVWRPKKIVDYQTGVRFKVEIKKRLPKPSPSVIH